MPMILRDKNGFSRAMICDYGMCKLFDADVGEWDVNPVTGNGNAYIIKYYENITNLGVVIYIHKGDYFTNP